MPPSLVLKADTRRKPSIFVYNVQESSNKSCLIRFFHVLREK